MQTKFMISYKDRKLGPLTESQIRKMLAGKQIQPTDYFFDDEKQDWVPLLEKFSDGAPSSAAQTPSPQSSAAPSPQIAKGKSAPPPPHKKQSLDEAPKNQKPAMLLPESNDFEVLEMSEPAASSVAPFPESPKPKSTEEKAPEAKIQNLKPGPKPTSKPAALAEAAPSPAVESSKKVQLEGGIGTLSLTQVKAGPVSLHLKSDSGMELPLEIKLTVEPAPASVMKVEAPEESRAGEDILVKLSAWDSYENLAVDFEGSFEVHLVGSQKESQSAKFEKGTATVHFKPTRAESVTIQVKESGQHKLSLPAPVSLKVHPNVPVKLIAEAPDHVRAGENIDLKLTALDAFGNVVSDFKGEIDLKVEATVKKVS